MATRADTSTPQTGELADPCARVLDEFVRTFRLNERMARILRLSLCAATNKEIAYALQIDVRTLSTHWARIYARTGTRSSQEFRALLFHYAVTSANPSPPFPAPTAGAVATTGVVAPSPSGRLDLSDHDVFAARTCPAERKA